MQTVKFRLTDSTVVNKIITRTQAQELRKKILNIHEFIFLSIHIFILPDDKSVTFSITISFP